MAESDQISIDQFKVLVERSGMQLSDDELESLKPMYDFYAERLTHLHGADLDAEDLAIAFNPVWESREGQV